MSDQITEQTVTWCHTHDWGNYATFRPATDKEPAKVVGLHDWSCTRDINHAHQVISFTSRKALREWAGY